jgi:hypothetical protein
VGVFTCCDAINDGSSHTLYSQCRLFNRLDAESNQDIELPLSADVIDVSIDRRADLKLGAAGIIHHDLHGHICRHREQLDINTIDLVCVGVCVCVRGCLLVVGAVVTACLSFGSSVVSLRCMSHLGFPPSDSFYHDGHHLSLRL